MSYKKYIKRGDKTFGPYVYHSKKVNGKVISEYEGKYEKKSNKKIWIFASIILVLLFSLLLFINNNSDESDFQLFNSAKEFFSKSIYSLTGFDVLDANNSEENNNFPENIIPSSNETIIPSSNETIENTTINPAVIINESSSNETFDNETNITSAENATNITGNDTGIIDINITSFDNATNEINLTEANETELNITNETIINITETANATISTIQLTPQITLGQTVKWKKQINPESQGNLTITLPKEAENIDVIKINENVEDITSQISITGGVIESQNNFFLGFIKGIIGAITGRAVEDISLEEKEIEIQIDEPNASYEVEYETPAPYAIEEEKPNGKIITIVGPDTIHYENVLSFASLNESLNIKNPSSVKIHWVENSTYLFPSSIQDLDNNGVYDYIEWNVPHLSNQTFEIIVITKAEHLDSNREFVSDIYEQVRSLDDVWSETINDNEYARITFEQNLTSDKDITIYPRVVSGNPIIEVYENNETDLIATFNSINSNEYNQIFLTNLQGTRDTFDLKVAGGSVEFDYIVDPTIPQYTGGLLVYADTVDVGLPKYQTFNGSFGPEQNATSVGAAAIQWMRVVASPTRDEWIIATKDANNDIMAQVCNGTETGLSCGAVTTITTEGIATFRDYDVEYEQTSGDALLVYGTSAADILVKIEWNGGAWVNNASITTTRTTGTVEWVELTSRNNSNEIGIAYSDSNDDVSAYRWNGSAAVNESTAAINTIAGAGDVRKFDISFEGVSGNMLVASPTTGAGTTARGLLTVAGTWTLVNETLPDVLTAYIDLQEPNPLDNDIAMISLGTTATATLSEGYEWNTTTIFDGTAGDDPARNFTANRMPGAVAFFNGTYYAVAVFSNLTGGDDIDWWTMDSAGAITDRAANLRARGNSTFIDIFDYPNLTRGLLITSDLNNDLWADTWDGAGTPGATSWTDLTSGGALETSLAATNTKVFDFSFRLAQEPDITAPGWQNPSLDDSTPDPGQLISHNINWTDDRNLNYATLEVNSSGINCDTTTNVSETALSGLSAWANLSWTIPNVCEGKTIGWKQYANDTSNNWNVTDLQTYNVQAMSPIVTFGTNPVDNYNSSSESITFDLKASDNTGVGYLQLYGNWSGAWAVNQTNSSPFNNTFWNVTVTGIPEGKYIWAGWGNDTAGNSAFTTTNRTFTIDTSAPIISLPVYINGTIKENTDTLTLNISVSDAMTAPSYCKININGTNQTFAVNNGWCNTTSGNLTNLADGNRTINVYANDTVGNWGLNNSFVVTIDGTSPVISLPFYVNATVKTPAQSLTLNISVIDALTSPSSCKININGTNQTFAVNNGWCNTTSGNLTNLGDGNRTINVYANDSANNFGLNNSYVVWIDSSVPVAEFGTNPIDNYNSSSSSILFDLRGYDNIGIDYLVLYGNWSGSWIPNQTNASPFNNTFWNATVTGIPDGKWRWAAWVNDTPGNHQVFSLTNRTFTVDTITPFIDFGANVAANNSNFSRNYVFVNASYIETNPKNITFTIFNTTGIWNSTTYLTSSNTTNTTINFTGLADSVYDYNITIYDIVNHANTTQTRRITLDTTIPQILFTTGTEANATSKNQQSVFANVSITEANLKNITYTLQNGSGIVNQTTYTTYINQTNWTNLNNSNVLYTYNVSIYDTAGNYNQTETRYLTLISNQAPSIKIFYPTNITYITDVSQLNYTATDDNAVSYCWYSLNEGASNSTPSATCLNATGLTSNEGSNTWTVYANDSAGLVGFNSTTFIKDTIKPNVQFVSRTTSSGNFSQSYIEANVSASDSGTGLNTTKVTLYNATGVIRTSINTSSYNFTNFTGLLEGTYLLNATANDSAGNENQTETRTIFLDATNPAVSLYSPANNTNSSTISNTFIANVSDNIFVRNVSLLINGTINQTNASGFNGTSYSFNVNLPDGFLNWSYQVYDFANNINTTTVRLLTVDTITPLISYGQGVAANNSNVSRSYVFVNVSYTEANPKNITFRISNATGVWNTTTYLTSNTTTNTSINFTNLANGVYDYNATLIDRAGNSNTTQTNRITLDTTNPAVLLYFPANSTNSTTTSNTFIANVSDNIFVRNVSLLINGTINQTNTSQFNGTSYSFNVNLPDGFWNWSYQVYDYTNNSNATTARWMSVDTIIPQISFTTGTENNATTFARNWIFANVSVTEANEHTITFSLYNSGSLVNQTSYTTPVRTINWTSLPNANYRYNVTINDTSNNRNTTETKYITLDTQGPDVSGLTESPADPATYSENGVYRFNATITDPSLDTVIFGFNNVNYTTTNVAGDIYNATVTGLTAGTYNYRWYANDTFGNMNSTETGTYTINKASSPLSLVITPSASETYGVETTANGSGCPSQLTCNLYRNSVLATNPNIVTLGVGIYNYTYNTTGNANYTAASLSQNLTINQATGVVFTYLDNIRANKTIEQLTAIYLNGTLENGTGAIKLYNNGTLINQGTSPLSNLTNFTLTGLYNITTTYDGNANYTASSETWWVNVTPIDTIPPQINLTNPLNKTYNATQTTLNYTASDNIGLTACWYSLNNGTTNTTITCGQNATGLNSGEGTSTWRAYANDSRGNLNSSSVTFFVDSINPTVSFELPTEGNASELTRNYIQVNVTAVDTNLNAITIRLYNSSSNALLRTNYSLTSPFFINYTGLPAGNYSFNATANDTLNNLNSTETRQVYLVKPTLNITKPENETYISGNNLQLNFTASNQDYVWYRIDAGSNTTISTNITFNTTTGEHTLYLFANNSNGETAKNVTFTVNSTRVVILYNNYTSEGSSTNFNSTSFEDLQNLSGIILEKTSYGKIQFNEAINVTNDSNLSDNIVDLDSNAIISPNLIELNSTAIPNFNKSATLFLYGLTFSNPRILRDGELCPVEICTQQSYSSGTLVFSVTQFSNYSAEESPAVAIAAGGAGGKRTSQVECIDDSQCTDGKVCWENQCVKLFDVKIIDFKSPAKLGEFFEFTYYMKGQADINNDVVVSFWIEQDRQKVTSGSDTIYMGTFDEKTETTKIFLPTTLESGVYEFYVEVYFEKYHANSHRTIQIEVKNGIATITSVEPNITLYIILGSILLVLVLFFIVYLMRRRRGYEKPMPVEKKPEAIKEISRKEILPVEKKVHAKKYLLRKMFASISVVLSNIRDKFASMKARYKARKLSEKKAERIIPKKIPQTKPEVREKSYLLESIFEKIKVPFLRIKYWFTSIKPKYEAGIYKKDILKIEKLPGKILKPIEAEIKKINRFKQVQPRRESAKPKEKILEIKPQAKKIIRKEQEKAKPNKGPKTVKEIIEELKEESEKNN